MHGMDKSCRLAAQDKGGGLIHSDCSDRVPLGNGAQRHDVVAVAWNCSVFWLVDQGNGRWESLPSRSVAAWPLEVVVGRAPRRVHA